MTPEGSADLYSKKITVILLGRGLPLPFIPLRGPVGTYIGSLAPLLETQIAPQNRIRFSTFQKCSQNASRWAQHQKTRHLSIEIDDFDSKQRFRSRGVAICPAPKTWKSTLERPQRSVVSANSCFGRLKFWDLTFSSKIDSEGRKWSPKAVQMEPKKAADPG